MDRLGARRGGPALRVGWAYVAAPVRTQEPRKREGRRAGEQKETEPVVASSARCQGSQLVVSRIQEHSQPQYSVRHCNLADPEFLCEKFDGIVVVQVKVAISYFLLNETLWHQ